MTQTGIAHPALQIAAAGSLTAGLANLPYGFWLALPGSIYYVGLGLYEASKALKAWCPDPKSLPGKLLSLWQADKPYLVAIATLVYAGAQAFNYPMPNWAYGIFAALGIATIHASTKGKPST